MGTITANLKKSKLYKNCEHECNALIKDSDLYHHRNAVAEVKKVLERFRSNYSTLLDIELDYPVITAKWTENLGVTLGRVAELLGIDKDKTAGLRSLTVSFRDVWDLNDTDLIDCLAEIEAEIEVYRLRVTRIDRILGAGLKDLLK